MAQTRRLGRTGSGGSHYTWQQGDLILHCQVQTNAASDQIVGLHGERIKIRITAAPIDGKANDHILKWFSKIFNVPKKDVDILQGTLNNLKTLRIRSPANLPTEIVRLT